MGSRTFESSGEDVPLIALEEVVAGYRGPVTAPVSLVVRPGEIVGLRGPNAAGKTTILNAIIGTARIYAGQIVRREGLRVAVQQQRPMRLGEMPLTGRELLRLTGADREPPLPWLSDALDSRLDRLSGGKYQLLYVWASLASGAELILLDEPTNNMDPVGVAALHDALVWGGGQQSGMLLISHMQEFLDEVCTRIVQIDGCP